MNRARPITQNLPGCKAPTISKATPPPVSEPSRGHGREHRDPFAHLMPRTLIRGHAFARSVATSPKNMPPKKEQLSKDGADLARLVEKYDIQFKGPVPRSEWPKHLLFEDSSKHRFSVLREIWGNRYEKLKRKRGSENLRSDDTKARADELRRRALKLRDNLNPNESTWRANIEQFVFDKFQRDVIWSVRDTHIMQSNSLCTSRKHCGGEIHEPMYEAQPLTTDARTQLQQRRSERARCNVRDRAVEFSSTY
jgi:hypothetical protein